MLTIRSPRTIALIAAATILLAVPSQARTQEKSRFTEEELAQLRLLQPGTFDKLQEIAKEMDTEVLQALQRDPELYSALLESQRRYEKSTDPTERAAVVIGAGKRFGERYMTALEQSGVNLQAYADRMAETVNAVQAVPVIVRVEQAVLYFEPAKPTPPADPPAAPSASKPLAASDFHDDVPEVSCGLGAGGRYRVTPTAVGTSAISGFLGGCSAAAYKAARPAPRGVPFTVSSTADLRIHGTLWGGTGGASCVATASHSFHVRLTKTPWAAVLFPAWFDESMAATRYSITHAKPTASFSTYAFSATALGGADCYADVSNIAGSSSP